MREPGDHQGGLLSTPADDAADLALRATRRDPDAWSRLFELHFRAVFIYVRHRLASATEAEDIASQVFEVGYRRASNFDYRGVPIEAWLLGIARNLVREHYRRAGPRDPSVGLEEDDAPRIEDASPAIALRRDIEVAMRHLTDDQQMVITLRFLLDRPVAETAMLMGRSEDAVKLLQRRALAALQRQLGAGYREGGL